MKFRINKEYAKKYYRRYWFRIFIITVLPAFFILIGLMYFNKLNAEVLVIDFEQLDRLNGNIIMWQAIFCTSFLLLMCSLVALVQYCNYGGFKGIEIDSEQKIIYVTRNMYNGDNNSVAELMKLGYVISSLDKYFLNSAYIIIYGEILYAGDISTSKPIKKENIKRKKKKLYIPRIFEEKAILDELEKMKSKK